MKSTQSSPAKEPVPPVHLWQPSEAEKKALASYRATEEASKRPATRNQEIVGIRIPRNRGKD